jgi:PhzF family phenazine biosynthesis protein
MKLPIYQLDAFTSRLFGGNPAAIVVLQSWLPDETMLKIAAENNLAETAFVIPLAEICPIRWFTPAVEVDLCGHATLAAGHVLLTDYYPSKERVVFSSLGGDLSVSRAGRLLSMDFPSRPGKKIDVSPELIQALGAKPLEAVLARDILALFESEKDVRRIRPKLDKVAALDAFGVIVSAPGDSVDFVSRFFGPRAGVPEDPVTGSAHCTLTPYWSSRLGKQKLIARQVSARGGELVCEMQGDRVIISGQTVEYLRGEISIE